jgi:hypothetical protein
LEKRSTIILAFIPKYVDGIYGCTTQAFPGATIGRLSQLVSSGRVNLTCSSVDFIIIQIGTTCNNISNGDSI